MDGPRGNGLRKPQQCQRTGVRRHASGLFDDPRILGNIILQPRRGGYGLLTSGNLLASEAIGSKRARVQPLAQANPMPEFVGAPGPFCYSSFAPYHSASVSSCLNKTIGSRRPARILRPPFPATGAMATPTARSGHGPSNQARRTTATNTPRLERKSLMLKLHPARIDVLVTAALQLCQGRSIDRRGDDRHHDHDLADRLCADNRATSPSTPRQFWFFAAACGSGPTAPSEDAR